MYAFLEKSKLTSTPKSAAPTRHFLPQSEQVSAVLHRGSSDLTEHPIDATAVIQPKLKVNTPGDFYEQEADRVADQVVRMPEVSLVKPAPVHGVVQRIQRYTASNGSAGVFSAKIQRQGWRERARRARDRAKRALQKGAEKGKQAYEETTGWWGRGDGDISKISFDGKAVTLHGTPSMVVAARSGLMPHHKKNPERIDYTQPQYQHVKDKGPVPKGQYHVRPNEVDNNPPSRAWGGHRVLMHESLVTEVRRRATMERDGGFFLHGDGGNDGTAGCIGIINLKKNAEVLGLIEDNDSQIPLQVDYPASTTESGGTVQRQAKSTEDTPAPAYENAVGQCSSGGRALTVPERQYHEPRFEQDFRQVRVHEGPQAARAANSVNAKAFTLSHNIVMGEGAYSHSSLQGRRLMAHELTHVVQQKGSVRRLQRVQLTYDDGPDAAGQTRRILNDLNSAGAKATFYLVGRRVVEGENWRTVFDIAKAGHWLGNHAYDWDMSKDNHKFLEGSVKQRAQKILMTEWAIRDALIRGRTDAKANGSWDSIPQKNRDYIEDVIHHGTGRFRTPGFRSKPWTSDGSTTLAAIATANSVLAAMGLRPLKITEVGTISREGVTVDPEDWRKGRTPEEILEHIRKNATSNEDTILLHSRLKASADITPNVVRHIKSIPGGSFDPTVQGERGTVRPRNGFAGLSTISSPPTSAQLAAARRFFWDKHKAIGPVLAGSVAIGIFQLAHEAGPQEVDTFIAEIRSARVKTEHGEVPISNWLHAYDQWRLFASMLEVWRTQKPFPRIEGLTL